MSARKAPARARAVNIMDVEMTDEEEEPPEQRPRKRAASKPSTSSQSATPFTMNEVQLCPTPPRSPQPTPTPTITPLALAPPGDPDGTDPPRVSRGKRLT